MDQSGSTGTPGTSSSSGWAAPPSLAKAAEGFNVKDFLAFKYLITPPFMTIIYIIGAIGITLGSLASLTNGMAGLIFGLVLFVFGNLYWRIILEFIMVLFSMNGALQSIDRRGKGM